jgi:hypothetical protein
VARQGAADTFGELTDGQQQDGDDPADGSQPPRP